MQLKVTQFFSFMITFGTVCAYADQKLSERYQTSDIQFHGNGIRIISHIPEQNIKVGSAIPSVLIGAAEGTLIALFENKLPLPWQATWFGARHARRTFVSGFAPATSPNLCSSCHAENIKI